MSQVLNSLVVSGQAALQRELENIMINNTHGHHLVFSTCAIDKLATFTGLPDLIFMESAGLLAPEEARQVVMMFPRKSYVVIENDSDTARRRSFLKVGVDEVMSLQQLQSDMGRHLLEKLLALKELTEAEARIEQSEERFRGIIEHARDMITLLDEEGTIIYNSNAFRLLLGYETWEALGQSFFDFVHEEDRPRVEKQFRRLVAAPEAEESSLEFRFRHKDGRWRVFEAMVSNLLRNDLVMAMVLNSRDVTEQRESEAELAKYRLHLEDLVERRTHELAEALKTERAITEQQRIFVSMVSHEFRTPLTIIDGNAQIIQKRGGSLTPEMMEKRAATIRDAVARLVQLIETVLSTPTLESGKLTVNPAPCSLIAIIRDTCMDQLGISPNHRIAVDIQGNFPEMMLDEKVIRQAMTNLMANAIKYSPGKDVIEVGVRREDDVAVIEVTDHGVGIPRDELPKIFTRYFRASTSGGIPGSGLGLSLVKQFVGLHEGSIDIQSETGVGTTVTMRLPIKEAHRKEGEANAKNTAG